MLTWGPRALLGRSKLPVAGRLAMLICVNRCRPWSRARRWGKWLRASQIVCLENSHFSRLNSSTGQVMAGDA
jgi:hypothetical protein